MDWSEAAAQLEAFASSLDLPGTKVHRAVAVLDERQDGEQVVRIFLLLDEPKGDTWDVDQIRELRHSLGRRATDMALPPVSLTLVPESEADTVEAFSR